MGLFSLSKGSEAATARSSDEALVERARTSARRRLIGAVVLLGIGVVAFPLIFETQPRPIPVDIPIEIPRKDSQPPVALPPAKPAAPAVAKPAAVITESKADAPREPAAPPAASAAAVAPAVVAKAPPPQPATKVEAKAEPRPEVKAAPKPETKTEAKPEAKAEPKPEAKTAAPASRPGADSAAGRFVVQVGAFAEANAVRDVRGRVEKLGLATYTQSVDTAGGQRTRVRVGPFASRDEADKVAAKLKAAGLPGAVLAL